jgi:hypothetical protein
LSDYYGPQEGIGNQTPSRGLTGMTKELAKYISEIRNDLQSKIKMLEPMPDMSVLQARRAQILMDDCKRLDAAIEQFTRQELQQRRKWAA